MIIEIVKIDDHDQIANRCVMLTQRQMIEREVLPDGRVPSMVELKVDFLSLILGAVTKHSKFEKSLGATIGTGNGPGCLGGILCRACTRL